MSDNRGKMRSWAEHECELSVLAAFFCYARRDYRCGLDDDMVRRLKRHGIESRTIYRWPKFTQTLGNPRAHWLPMYPSLFVHVVINMAESARDGSWLVKKSTGELMRARLEIERIRGVVLEKEEMEVVDGFTYSARG